MPKRVQLKGTKANPIVPNGAVDVTENGILDGLYGNPFSVKKYGRDESLRLYLLRLHDFGTIDHIVICHHIDEIQGKDLACWCELDERCHADLLLEFANEPMSDERATELLNNVNARLGNLN